VNMAQSRHETNHGQREAELGTPRGAGQTETATQRGAKEVERATQRGVEALRQQAERVAQTGRAGVRQAGKISAAAFTESARTGSTLADATQDVVSAWAGYAEDLMRNTSRATEALLGSRTFAEMMQVQANLMMNNIQSFLNHSANLADSASRLAMRPFEALREVSAEEAHS
jgi:hypothetical protein